MPQLVNAEANTWKNYYLGTVTFKCLDGYRINDPNIKAKITALQAANKSLDNSVWTEQKIVCEATGIGTQLAWNDSNRLIVCMPKSCPQPKEYGNTFSEIQMNKTYWAGERILYTCFVGFKLGYMNATADNVTCSEDKNSYELGTWSPSIGNCYRTLLTLLTFYSFNN